MFNKQVINIQVAKVIDEMTKKYDLKELEAIKIFYNTSIYERLASGKTDLNYRSAYYIMDLLEESEEFKELLKDNSKLRLKTSEDINEI